MKNHVLGMSLCIMALAGCGGAPDAGDDEVSLATATQAIGVAPITYCWGGSGGPGWPGSISDWYQIYGTFGNNGNNVTASVVCTFPDGSPPVQLYYQGSNYRSSTQVNLNYGATVTTCARTCYGTVYDSGAYIGSFSYQAN